MLLYLLIFSVPPLSEASIVYSHTKEKVITLNSVTFSNS